MGLFQICITFLGESHPLGKKDSDYVSLIMLKRAAKELVWGNDFVHPEEKFYLVATLPKINYRLELVDEFDVQYLFKCYEDFPDKEINIEVEYLPLDSKYPEPEPLALPDNHTPVNEKSNVDVVNEDAANVDAATDIRDGNVDIGCEVGGRGANANENSNDDVGTDDSSMGSDYESEAEDSTDEDADNDEVNGTDEDSERRDGDTNDEDADQSIDSDYVPNAADFDEEVLSGYESNDDSECGYCTSSDEEENVVSRLASQMKKDAFRLEPNGKISLKKGLIFQNVNHFREVILDYSIQEGFILKRTKNEKYRVNVRCIDDSCTWMCKATWGADKLSFEIQEYGGNHFCQRTTKFPDANARWMCRKINEMVRESPEITLKTLADHFRREYGLESNDQQLYRAKRKALDLLSEDHVKSYAKLYKYGNILIERNPGTVCIVKCYQEDPNASPLFHRFFLSLGCQKQGFISGCRPFVGLDGCHLKGPFGGALLAAVALDANNGLFPLAIAICEGENIDSWGWFLFTLLEHLGDDERRTITFMSDRQKGLISAVQKVWPNAHHRYCARHLFNNYKKTVPGPQFRGQFWGCARTSDEIQFNVTLWEMFHTNQKGYQLVTGVDPKHWSKHKFDTTSKSDHVTNNLTESFNSWLGSSRDKPILTLVEDFRTRLMRRMRRRRMEATKWKTTIPPKVATKIENIAVESRNFRCLWARDKEFEIAEGTNKWEVNLDTHTCSCNGWQVSGIPCAHAMTAIHTCREKVVDFIHEYHKKEMYLKTYSEFMGTIPDERNWPEVDCWMPGPPKRLRQPGRPSKNNRRRDPDEGPAPPRKKKLQRCSLCKDLGHNKLSCPVAPRNNQRTRKTRPKQGGKARQNNDESASTSTAHVQREARREKNNDNQEGLSSQVSTVTQRLGAQASPVHN